MIRMLNVSKVYLDKVHALRNVNLHIAKGEFVFVVGPSGAGKSTLARLVYREELPTSGQVYVAGKNVARLRPREVPALRRNVGVVFQDFKLLPDKTVYENVAFAMQVTEARGREIRKRVPEVLELVGLLHKAKMRPLQLSGGEQQRASLARAIVNRPPILIADEPTGNLDPDTSWEIMKLFEDINCLGTTVIVCTHAEAIVNRMRKRVVALRDGEIVMDREKGAYVREA